MAGRLAAVVKRALVVGDDSARGLLAAVRSLAANGWHVGVATPTRRSLAASSRYAARWHPLANLVPSVAAAVRDGRYDVVLPGGDAELYTLSERRDEIDAVVPYGSRESVRWALDKAAWSDPRTGTTGRVVVKSRSHATVRVGTVVTADPAERDRAVAAIRAAGAEPVVQEYVPGPLGALSVVVGRSGDVLAAVQQRAGGLWPKDAGISTRAETVPVDAALLGRVTALLAGAGWAGLVQAQFIEGPDGPRLLDLNGRCYGSLALAAAAGVDLAHVWAADATGQPVVAGTARVGVRYQWLYGDLRRAGVAALRHAPGAAHSVWDRRDPRPALAYLRTFR